MFIIGAVLDGFVAIVMLVPSLEALAWGFDEPVRDPGYRFAMTFGASLMVAWTALLLWAAARPVDRRAVAPLTMLVVAGLMSAEFLGMASGFLPALRVWALLVFQVLLQIGFALAYLAASER
jgi:hypothetical protein